MKYVVTKRFEANTMYSKGLHLKYMKNVSSSTSPSKNSEILAKF